MGTHKREDILAAALKMVSIHGFHGASMAMIAEEARSGAGTIYNYFPSKEALIKALFREMKVEYIHAILQGVDPSRPLEETFLVMWRNAVRFNLECPEKVTFSQQYHSSPYLDEESQHFVDAAMEPLLQPFASAMQRGIIKNLPLPILEAYTLDIVASLALRNTRGEIVLDESLIEQTGRASWQALLA